MGAKESGSSFIAGVLAKLPEADRAAAQALFSKPEAEAAVVLIGDGVLARSDYSKNMDDLKKDRELIAEQKKNLDDWFVANKAALEEYVEIKPEYDQLKAGHVPDPNKPAATGLTKADLEKELGAVIDQNNRAFAGALALATDLAAKHFAMFSEPLSTTELLANPKLGRPIDGQPGRVFGLQDAYDEKHGARVQEKATAAEQARINKMVEDKLAEERRKQPQPMPYPMRDPSPSPLDALTATDRKPADYSVDSAVETYEKLSQTRQQATGA